MDTDERLMALKKAYADIILNMEKEAAKRIMVSERKVVRLEYELKIAKEDAVQMLMRVKQMMDCKVCRDKNKQPRIWKDVSHVKG
ncbi:hypothetical protein HanHA300_Chr08g0290851 [Helianthus annuus]|nr:hypothetical protein HanHA300_Chr08g0290851 [Helianthus annuus]KAJ0548140.1 hypothetical protein HanIR_Chr08g0380211 [Helianthus annuus]KAJ0554555.1 hypothetical protein HanHA89_Chr08g0309261 [Helianthus annuus]